MGKIRRLLDYFAPQHYQLQLNIEPEQSRFSGQVTVTGETVGKQVRLHSKDLDILSVKTERNDSPDWRLSEDELIIDDTANEITVQFQGRLSDTAMNGLYLCKYRQDGHTCRLFATQFESHYARKCFPCVDEPSAKATFDLFITVNSPDVQTVLSNMPGEQINHTWRFQTTPKMSTYLLAFVGGNFVSKSDRTKRGVKVNVYATPAQPTGLLDYALDTAVKSVEFYEDYFGIDYPLPKLDNVALPDFSAGAMENWGLITYRESAMLADNNSAVDTRESVAITITHEIAHQWFGNLVTMAWWDDLWLNESFASLMEHIVTDRLHPEYHVMDDFQASDVFYALTRDSLAGVQAVRQTVGSPDEIATLFDGAIVYIKGERLMKMLRRLIGEEQFRRALRHYFTKHKYSNTVADDLWQAMSKVSKLDIAQLMKSWLTEPGYPIITADLIEPKRLRLKRAPLHADSPVETRPVPLFCNLPDVPKLMTESEIVLDAPTDQIIQLNVGGDGHYLTEYDDQLFTGLRRRFSNLSTIDKIELLQESFFLSQLGRRNISQQLDLLSEAGHETNQAIIGKVAGLTAGLDRLVDLNSDEQAALRQFVSGLFKGQFTRIFQGRTDDINDTKARPIILSRLVYARDEQAIAYCDDLHQQHVADISQIDSNLRSVVLSAEVRLARPGVFDQLWELYLSVQDVELRLDICSALTATTDLSQADKLLTGSTVTTLIRPQDNYYFISGLMANRYTRSTAWCWIRHNWSWIEEVFGGDMNYDSYVQVAGHHLSTDDQLVEYDNFFKGINAPALSRTIKLGHNDIVRRLRWIKRNQPILTDFLRQRL
ncbi:M1 family metallopeptidase [Candidatus Saccharibacteria bacterium]|nr:M1 family metallopeptidase [Candidatus Saccharibacteria bacterium]